MTKIKALLLVLFLAGLFVQPTVPCAQQADSNDLLGDSLVGVIPGTDMLRDEFRARGEAQLVALALDALVHHTVFGAYPASLAELMGSEAYNLKPVNMFTDRPIGSVYFVPTDQDMTNEPYLNILFEFEKPTPPVVFEPSEEGEFGGFGQLAQMAFEPRSFRVRPQAITSPTPGDVFYYTDGELLQLIMYAPDGTFVEHVEESPHYGWRSRMNIGPAGSDWPFDFYSAQVLLFLDVLLPRYYSYVQFMGDDGQYPRTQLKLMGSEQRLNLAAELKIDILNPLSREQITVIDEPQPGCLLSGSPIAIALRSGQILTQSMLDEAPPADFDENASSSENLPKPDSKPGRRPPLGGR